MKFSKLLGSAGVFSAVLSGSSAALADYVCQATLMPGSTSLGSDGYVFASYYTAPNCGGSFSSTRFYCSTSPTSGSCSSSSAHRSDSVELVGLVAALQRAAIHDEEVTAFTTTCVGGGGTCGSYVTFRAN